MTDYIPISALQHYLYCPRQCALIHLEQIWSENVHTAEGRHLHEKAHGNSAEKRGDFKVVTGLLLSSESLGLYGQADVVEFHKQNDRWHPYPVEYKRGGPKDIMADQVQLCAQAICLEEMLGENIDEGALFYGKNRRRQKVKMDAVLRERTQQTVAAVWEMLRQGRTPPKPTLEIANVICPSCSLVGDCMALTPRTSAAKYIQSIVKMV
ncbi:MAG: CRISPR-associated protein Cas4 [Desulfovibrionaceae bacterium]|nr:CRISPR-associated protein Cas4 [Desulfovibrionaceae bacterium]